MREMTAKLAGKDITLAASFKASVEVAQKVADPMLIARELAVEERMMEVGWAYRPTWQANTENVPVIIHIGMKAAGDKRELDDVQELVFDHGIVNASGIAMEYLSLLLSPQPRVKSEESADTPGKP